MGVLAGFQDWPGLEWDGRFCAEGSPGGGRFSKNEEANASSASLFESSMAPCQVLSDRIATNWSDLVGSNATNCYPISIESMPIMTG